jgi:transposase
MATARTLVGLDVHASKIVAAMLDARTGELRFSRLGGETRGAVALCAGLAPPVRVVYEPGPTGFGLARGLVAAGVECVVAAPGKIRAPLRIGSRLIVVMLRISCIWPWSTRW